MDHTSMYSALGIRVADLTGPSDPDPPGTIHTATIETIDNDRALTLLEWPSLM